MTEHSATAMTAETDLLLERKRLLDDVWMMAFFALFVAIGIPWYLRALEIDFAPVAWSVFGYGACYALVMAASEQFSAGRSLLWVIGATQVTGTLFLGWIWHLTGGMQNPMFLLAFVLPVVAGSLIPVNWQAYTTALLALATVIVVAVIDTPELRWFVTQIGSVARRLIAMIPPNTGMSGQPFPTLNTPPTYNFVLLAMFAALMFTVALMTESLTSFVGRVSGRLQSATQALDVAEGLSSEVLRLAPLPAAMVYSDTFRIAQASESFLHHFFLSQEALLDRDLFSLVSFSHPEVVQTLIAGDGGDLPVAVYHVDGEARSARIHVDPVVYGGRRYAFVSILDITAVQTLAAALQAVEQALIVMNSKNKILYFNAAAVQMWGEMQPGMDVAIPLRKASLPDKWWELGLRSRQERRLEMNGSRVEATCIAARLVGERDALTVLSFRTLGREA